MNKNDVSGMNLSVPGGNRAPVQTDGPENYVGDAAGCSRLKSSLIPGAVRRSEIASCRTKLLFDTTFTFADLFLLLFEGQTF